MQQKMREYKDLTKAEDYCKSKQTQFILPYLKEVNALTYNCEPNYSKLKFILVKALLELGIKPNKNVLCSGFDHEQNYEMRPLRNDLISLDESENMIEQDEEP